MRPVTLTITIASGVDSSRSRNRASSSLASRCTLSCVTSFLLDRKYSTCPSASHTALVDTLTCTSEPSLRRRTASCTEVPRRKASVRKRSSSCARPWGTIRSNMERPCTSACEYPKISSAAGFHSSTTPWGDSTSNASGFCSQYAAVNSVAMQPSRSGWGGIAALEVLVCALRWPRCRCFWCGCFWCRWRRYTSLSPRCVLLPPLATLRLHRGARTAGATRCGESVDPY